MMAEDEERYLSTAAAAAFTGYAPGTLRNWRCQGKGPAHGKDSAGGIRYRLSDLRAFMGSPAQAEA